MSKSPIVFIDADEDDQAMFKLVLDTLGKPYPVVPLSGGQAALDYLRTAPHPTFMILSEIDMPKMNGLEMRRQIELDHALRIRSIPFIFITHPVEDHLIEQAYELTIQGLFEKATSFEGWKTQLSLLINYWALCQQPNRVGLDRL